MNPVKFAVLGLALAALSADPALADGPCPPGVPAQVFCGGKTLDDVTAGTYRIDTAHTGVIARVSHIGYSYSVFRFGDVAGQLAWDPSDPGKDRLEVTVKTASIASPVPNFAAQLAGEGFLNAKAFPDATFVSAAFRRTDATHGKVEGRLTLLGKTRPVVFDVELVGAGRGFGGHPRMGVHATATITPQDFGMAPMFDTPILLEIDAEFEHVS